MHGEWGWGDLVRGRAPAHMSAAPAGAGESARASLEFYPFCKSEFSLFFPNRSKDKRLSIHSSPLTASWKKKKKRTRWSINLSSPCSHDNLQGLLVSNSWTFCSTFSMCFCNLLQVWSVGSTTVNLLSKGVLMFTWKSSCGILRAYMKVLMEGSSK